MTCQINTKKKKKNVLSVILNIRLGKCIILTDSNNASKIIPIIQVHYTYENHKYHFKLRFNNGLCGVN